ncbi:hypothetical protein LINGRAHAP2_LOCUS30759 [Linum grandiflorum]
MDDDRRARRGRRKRTRRHVVNLAAVEKATDGSLDGRVGEKREAAESQWRIWLEGLRDCRQRVSSGDLMQGGSPGVDGSIRCRFGMFPRSLESPEPHRQREARWSLEVKDEDLRVMSGKFSDQTAVLKR